MPGATDCFALIPARGGSKGIPRKNLIPFCGHPLIAWSIAAARRCPGIGEVYVSTDCPEIAGVAASYGAAVIERPAEISTDTASSESALLHACEVLSGRPGGCPELIVMMQATSPLRETSEMTEALGRFREAGYDSLFSAASPEDYLLWSETRGGLRSLNYDYTNRKRRQDADGHERLWVETGSFYITRTGLLRSGGNRLGGAIGVHEVPLWKSFEIDSLDGLSFCELLMRHHGLDREVPVRVG